MHFECKRKKELRFVSRPCYAKNKQCEGTFNMMGMTTRILEFMQIIKNRFFLEVDEALT